MVLNADRAFRFLHLVPWKTTADEEDLRPGRGGGRGILHSTGRRGFPQGAHRGILFVPYCEEFRIRPLRPRRGSSSSADHFLGDQVQKAESADRVPLSLCFPMNLKRFFAFCRNSASFYMQNVMVFERGSRFPLFALGPLENDRGGRGPPPRAEGADAEFFTVRGGRGFPQGAHRGILFVRALRGGSSSSAPLGGILFVPYCEEFRIRPAALGGSPLRPGPFPRGPSAKSGKRGSRPFESLFSNEFEALFGVSSKFHSISYAKRNSF